MIYSHKIVKDQGEEILYLYLDYSFEFSKEFDSNNKNEGIFLNIKKYLDNMKIKFNGKKIVLMVSGIAIALISLNTNPINDIKKQDENILYVSSVYFNENIENDEEIENIQKEEINENTEDIQEEVTENNKIEENKQTETTKENNNQNNNVSTTTTSDYKEANQNINQETTDTNYNEQVEENKTIVTVYRSDGSILNIELEEYLIGVVAAEIPASFNIEALKSQAIVARTYTLKAIAQNRKLTDTVSTQVYNDNQQLQTKWGNEYQKYYNKVKEAVDSTKGMYITYNGNYIEAVYHAISNGYTEEASVVWNNSLPYLKVVDSSWDRNVTNYQVTITKTYEEINNAFNINLNNESEITIISRNSSNRVQEIKLDGIIVSGIEFRTKLGLRSADFDVSKTDTGLTITTRGYGHGVGMSQYGANGMANSGYNYSQIISHYYPGTTILS